MERTALLLCLIGMGLATGPLRAQPGKNTHHASPRPRVESPGGATLRSANDSLARGAGTNAFVLRRLAADWGVRHFFDQEKALRLARQRGWSTRQTDPDGTLLSLQGLDELGKPHYYVAYNDLAALSTRTNLLWTGNRLGYSLSGGGTALLGRLGLWDSGRVRASHQELTGRVVQQDQASNLDAHATHVAGTMVASGVNLPARGMAFGANLRAWDFSADTPEMAAAAVGLLVSNHSYGSLCGWRASGRGWEWWGEPSLSETDDWKFGFYTSSCRDWDVITYHAPYYLPVKSAGNNRSVNGPAAGTTYFLANTSLTSTAPRNRNDGYDIVTTNGNAKNILTVGAVHPLPNGYLRPSDVVSAPFSSWGPADDGRIKPDLVGVGVNLLSAGAGDDRSYFFSSGTSMSAPNVSGSLLLLQELYARRNGGNFLRSATLKGLVLHTANEAGSHPGPDYAFGWGLLDAEKAARVIENSDGSFGLSELALLPNQVYSFPVVASGKGPLEITLSWTDPEGTVAPLSPEAVNNRTPKLVNDLDLRVTEGSRTYQPWTLDPDHPSQAATPGDNRRDNVEKVAVPASVPGKTYLVSVSHKGDLERGPQAYSLVTGGIGGKPYCASAANSATGAKILEFTFGSLQSVSADCAAYTDLTHLNADVTAGQFLSLRLTLGTCGADSPKLAKVFVDWNGDADFDDAHEWVATTDVLRGTQTYATTVGVPPGLVPGHSARLRVVCAETEDPTGVMACGRYAKGETQDYRVTFLTPANDAGVVALLHPGPDLCAHPGLGGATVVVRNFGTAVQSNIPVTTVVREGETVVATLSGTYAGKLAPRAEAEVQLRGTFRAEAGKTYAFVSRTGLGGDADSTNNGHLTARTASGRTPDPRGTATACGNDPTALRGEGNGTVFWYDALTSGNLLAAGNRAYTSFKPGDQTYYAVLNEFAGQVGPVGKYAFSGGGYGPHGAAVTFTTRVPLVLERVRLYVGNAGRVRFTVEGTGGIPVASTVLNVEATRKPALGGEAPDDPSDTGAVYYLNLVLPAAGAYRLTTAYEDGATLFRSNAGVAGYPFSIPHVMSIDGTTAGASTYAYLYDLHVRAAGCPSLRVAVVADAASEAAATLAPLGPLNFCQGDSTVLKADGGSQLGYQWQRDGQLIPGAVTDLLTVKEAGDYAVAVTQANGCRRVSAVATVAVTPVAPVAVRIVPAASPHQCGSETAAVWLRAFTEVDPAQLSFQWQKDGVDLAQATDDAYLATEAGYYTVTARRFPCGVSISDTLAINRETPGAIASQANVCGGSGSAQLTARSKGSLFWYDAPVGGNLVAVGDRYVTPVLTADRSYYVAVNDYRGTVANPNPLAGGGFSAAGGEKTFFNADIPFLLERATLRVDNAGAGPRTVTVTLTDRDFSPRILASRVVDVTPGIVEYPLDLFIPEPGQNYGLQVSAFGGGAQAYSLTDPGAIRYPYVLPGVLSITGNNQPNPAGYYGHLYYWKVKAAGCPADSRTEAKVRVLANPPPQAILSGSQAICEGDTARLSVELAGTPPWTVTYSDGTTPVTVSGIRVSPYHPAVTQPGNYALTAVYDANGCANGDRRGDAVVTVNAPPVEAPVVIVSGPTAFCLGGKVTLTASLGFDEYRWSTGETTRSVLVQRSGSYTVAGGKDRCWSPLSDGVTVTAHSPAEKPGIGASGPLLFCVGDSVTLNAPGGYGAYTWRDSTQAVVAATRSVTLKRSGRFTVTVGNAGCIGPASEPVSVTVSRDFPARPEITALGSRLTSSSAGNNQWLLNGVPVPGATQPTYVAPVGGRYAVRVSGEGCQSVSDELAVVITALPGPPTGAVQLYPNPAGHRCTLEYPLRSPTANVTATLCNAQGQPLRTERLRREGEVLRAVLDVGHLAAGVYFVKITDGGKVTVRALIKE
ncbi:MAG: S8 family serine peptidase [Ferruginibacter sp.]|nr:S8 family serine peptidase [Cytophagales bacterium]